VFIAVAQGLAYKKPTLFAVAIASLVE